MPSKIHIKKLLSMHKIWYKIQISSTIYSEKPVDFCPYNEYYYSRYIYIVRCFIPVEKGSRDPKALTDEELIRRFRSGEEESFEILVSRYRGLISSIASRFRGAAPDIDTGDLVQEGLIALLHACKSYSGERGMSFKNYLMLCAKNSYLSIGRSLGRKGNVPTTNIISIEDEEGSAFDPTDSSPDELIESKEYIAHLHRVMKERLSDLEYKVAILHLSGYSYREIADKLDISLKKVDNAQTRIRQKLSR